MLRNKNKKIREGGYTIIETMIAISLFMVVTTLGLGALLNANLLHNKTQDMRSIMDTLSFVMEDISRNLRTGTNYHCLLPNQASLPTTPKSCPSGIGIAFEESSTSPSDVDNDSDPTNDNDDQWFYYVNLGKMYKSTNGGASVVQITPDEVVITSTSFVTVIGAEPPPGDTRQPLVTIRLEGNITYKNVVTPFSLQTSVSQRSVDI